MIKESQGAIAHPAIRPFAVILRSGRLSLETVPNALPFQTLEVDTWDAVFRKLSSFRPGCLILDFDVDRDHTVAAIRRFADQGIRFSAVGITSDRSRRTLQQAMRFGFVDLVNTPIESRPFVEAVQEAFEADADGDYSLCEMRSCFGRLTPKEREMLPHLLQGVASRRLASRFQVSYQTIDRHRKHVVEKMNVDNMTELAMKLYRQY
ncbi:MAG: LuxR C-terminal-related transcriptional regulator [Planctomycetota bacterium]